MLVPHSPYPPYPPDHGPLPEASDQRLATALQAPSWALDPAPLGPLLARHWAAVHDYAELCAPTAGAPGAALAAAAVHQVLRCLERRGPCGVLRPRLLVAVRDTAGCWAAAGGQDGRHSPDGAAQDPGGTGSRALPEAVGGPFRPRADRAFALRSFHALSPAAQCLLWHTAVEAEPLHASAELLGLGLGAALTELEEARRQFGAGLLHWHHELTTRQACRFYGRLLGERVRPPGAVPPDLRHHLADCAYCAAAAAQLALGARRPGLLLAQAVLGPHAEEYVASRPGRRAPATGEPGSGAPAGGMPVPPRPGRAQPGERTWHAGRGKPLPSGPRTARRGPAVPGRVSARALLTGVGLASAFALGTVVTGALWPHGGGVPASVAPDAGAGPSDRTDQTSTATTADSAAGTTALAPTATAEAVGAEAAPATAPAADGPEAAAMP